MEIYVARQPIFDKNMNVYGYELLYRKGLNNFYEGNSDNQATADLISNSFLALSIQELTEGKRAFINFSDEMLYEKIPMLLSNDSIVVEILERSEYNEKLTSVAHEMRQAGYVLALDDFVFHESTVPIVEEVQIIKIEFPILDFKLQEALIKRFHKKVKFLAERVETREEYQQAIDMGYDYFQGYFFSKPIIVKGQDVASINQNLIRIVQELNSDTPDFQKITEIIETDVGLSYKLLRMANSVFFGATNRIHSIKNALVRLGLEEIRKWIYLMMLKDVQKVENRELIKTSLIRAKMMEQLAKESGQKNKHLEYFITGLFSSIDALLNKPMENIVSGLGFSDEVKDALIGKDNEVCRYLNFVKSFEIADWDNIEKEQEALKLDKSRLTRLYIETLQWAVMLDYN